MGRVEIRNVDDLRGQIGRDVAMGDWIDVAQRDLDRFAEAVGGRCAEGFYLLSLIPRLAASALAFPDSRLVVNYGLDQARFPAPVRAGQRIRARFAPSAVVDVPGGVQLTWTVTIEAEGIDVPVCVADTVSRRYSR